MDESMTKTDAREALSAYIDGELPTDQAGALEALLASDQEPRDGTTGASRRGL